MISEGGIRNAQNRPSPSAARSLARAAPLDIAKQDYSPAFFMPPFRASRPRSGLAKVCPFSFYWYQPTI